MRKLVFLLCAATVPLSSLACGDASTTSDGAAGNTNTGGTTTGTGATNTGASAGSTTTSEGGSTSQGGGGTGGSSTSTGATGGTGTGATGGGGTGGTGGSGGGWPTCDSPPVGVPVYTLNEIWLENPTMAKEVWVPGVFVTAISGGNCDAGVPCQFFVQQKETFASIAEGSQQALRVVVFPDASEHFVDIAVADQIDLRAYVYRHTSNGENELFFHVSQALPGCAKAIGTGNLVAVPGLDLVDLTVDVYEQTMGPLFIRLETVSGKPHLPDETFGLWESFMPGGGPIEEVTSMSPFFLPNGQFVGFTPEVIYNFEHVDGVFGLFAPQADPLIKYEEIYIRSMMDQVNGGQ